MIEKRKKSEMCGAISSIAAKQTIEASAPCRIDMGGTVDIGAFHYPLRHMGPCTFNIALNMRTRVFLAPHTPGRVKVSSAGFDSADFDLFKAPFDHPLGLMFSAAAFFKAEGVHIRVESSSPPRSSLGGSSTAAVALIAALSMAEAMALGKKPMARRDIALLAWQLESSVAGVPCGLQDQLAAAYGGVHLWRWHAGQHPPFGREPLFRAAECRMLERNLLLAYCGAPHASKDVNSRWVKQFIAGKSRADWAEIVICTQKFVEALKNKDFKTAAELMNREMEIRSRLTPEVFDETGRQLAVAGAACGCGVRIAGAGGGGCVWALGEPADVARLKGEWQKLLASRKDARLLDVQIDSKGVDCTAKPFEF